MENFIHEANYERLEGFNLTFYKSIGRIASLLCEVCDAKPDTMVFDFEKIDDDWVLLVKVFIEKGGSSMSLDEIRKYARTLVTFFPAFFTPHHYRPYDNISVLEDDGKIKINAYYSGGK